MYPSPARVKWLIQILLILRYNISKASCLQGFYVVSLYRKHWCYNVTRNLRWAGRLLATTLIINSWKISAFWGHSALHHFSPGVRHYQVITSNRTQVIEQINSSFSLMMILKKVNSAVISLLSKQKSLKYAIYVYIWFSGHGHYIDWLFKNVRHQEQQMLSQTSSTSSTGGGPLSNF